MTRPYTFSPEGLAIRQRASSKRMKRMHADPAFMAKVMAGIKAFRADAKALKRARQAATRTLRAKFADPVYLEQYRLKRADHLQDGFTSGQKAAFRTLVNHGIPREEARERILNRAKLRNA
jgi:hypothetical protein